MSYENDGSIWEILGKSQSGTFLEMLQELYLSLPRKTRDQRFRYRSSCCSNRVAAFPVRFITIYHDTRVRNLEWKHLRITEPIDPGL